MLEAVRVADNDAERDYITQEEIDRVFPRTPTVQGRLVIIGPTTRDDGIPNDVSELPENTPMWVGWVPQNDITAKLSFLQAGNPYKLAVYAVARASTSEVEELTDILDEAKRRMCGQWFMLWSPLAQIVRTLRGEIE